MKKLLLFISVLFILLFLNSAFIPKPKNDQSGGIIGRMILEFTNSWDANPRAIFKAGRYYDLTVYLEEKNTGKSYRLKTDRYGNFFVLNLAPGLYQITDCNLEDYLSSDYIWNMPNALKRVYDQNNATYYNEKMKRKYGFIMVNEKQITVLNTLIILNTFTKTAYHNASSDIKYEIDPDYDSVINNFKEKDKKGIWSNYTYFKHDEEKSM